MSVSTLFNTSSASYESLSIRVYDLIVDNSVTLPPGSISPASLGTGPAHTVLYSGGTGASWSSTPVLDSITLSATDCNALSFYSTDDVLLTATYAPDSYSAGFTGTFTRVGNCVTLSVPYSIVHTAVTGGSSGLLLGDIPAKYSSRTDSQEFVINAEGPNSDGSLNNTLRPVAVFIHSPSAGGGLANKIILGNSANIAAGQVLNFTRFTICYLH